MNLSAKYLWCAVTALAAVAQFPVHAQESNSAALVGHWRKTTVPFGEPRDENLMLRANGSAERWIVTAKARTPVATGTWRVDDKISHSANRGAKHSISAVYLSSRPARFSEHPK